MTQSVTLYTKQTCPFCIKAKALFDKKHIAYEEIAIDFDAGLREQMIEKAGRHTVPQIWIGDTHIGGCDDLFALERQGKLDALLQA